jgi:hypothetical protein
MEDFNSETDSDYTSYWRDWVSDVLLLSKLLGHHVSTTGYKRPGSWETTPDADVNAAGTCIPAWMISLAT